MNPDVVVIGGGCAGSAASYFLAKAGLRVVLLEKEALTAGSSGHSTGVSRVMLRDLDARDHATLNARAIPRLEKVVPLIEDETGMDVQYQPAPGMTIPMTEAAWEHMRAIAPGGGQTLLSGSAARELEPSLGPEVIGAAWEPLRRKLDSQSLTKTYARAAELRGATIDYREAVGLRIVGGRVTGVETTTGVVECGNVVLAMGIDAAKAGGWLGVRLPVIPIKGEALRLRYEGPRAKHLLTPFGLRPGYVEAGHVIFRKDGVVSVGSTIEDSGYEDKPTEAARERIMRMATYLWPALESAVVTEHVHGLRPVPADGLPILGPVPGVAGAYVIAGHSVCACSAMYAEITTDLVTRGTTEAVDSLEPFSLRRFGDRPLAEIEVFGIVRHMRQAAPVIEAAYPSPRR